MQPGRSRMWRRRRGGGVEVRLLLSSAGTSTVAAPNGECRPACPRRLVGRHSSLHRDQTACSSDGLGGAGDSESEGSRALNLSSWLLRLLLPAVLRLSILSVSQALRPATPRTSTTILSLRPSAAAAGEATRAAAAAAASWAVRPQKQEHHSHRLHQWCSSKVKQSRSL